MEAVERRWGQVTEMWGGSGWVIETFWGSQGLTGGPEALGAEGTAYGNGLHRERHWHLVAMPGGRTCQGD